jgi:hypothetical protein
MLAAGLVVSAGVVLAQRGPQGPQMRGDGPAPAAKPFSVTRSDPGMDAVAASDTKAELIASGFGLNEGPVWVPDPKGGYLLVGALLENVIAKVTPAGKGVGLPRRPASRATTRISRALRRAVARLSYSWDRAARASTRRAG